MTTQWVHKEKKFQHGSSLVQLSMFLSVSMHAPKAHRRLIALQLTACHQIPHLFSPLDSLEYCLLFRLVGSWSSCVVFLYTQQVMNIIYFFVSHGSALPPPPVPWRSYVGAAILGGGIGYTLAHLFKVEWQ